MGLPSDNSAMQNITLPTLPAEYMSVIFKSEDEKITSDYLIQNGFPFPLAASSILHSSVQSWKLISKRPDKNIIEVNFDLKDVTHEYLPGNTIGIIPSNGSLEVEEIFNILGLSDKLDIKCELSVISENVNSKKKEKSIPPHLPVSSTLRHIFENCVEIRGPPKKLFIRALAEYTSDQVEKNRLLVLCSKEGTSEYEKEFSLSNGINIAPGFGLLNLLRTFPSCSPPIRVLLQHLPRLKPRPYSIASSPLVSNSTLRILFSVYTEKDRKGVCTAWLENLLPPSSLEEKLNTLNLNGSMPVVPLFFRKSVGFNLPDEDSIPIILIGPGTGVSPFIGFLEHRAALKWEKMLIPLGEVWLFYGCQHPEIDFICENKLKGFVDDGVLGKLFLSFSRFSGSYNGWNGTKYVQDNIKEMGQKFAEQLLDKEAIVYVSGDAKNMSKDVMDVIIATIQEYKGIDKCDATNIVKEMIYKKKYLQDIWV